jgi:hypothetical protein
MIPTMLKYIRISIFIGIVACSIYLYWCGLPTDLAFVQYADNGQLGQGLIQFSNGDHVDKIAIMTLASGWSGIRGHYGLNFSLE